MVFRLKFVLGTAALLMIFSAQSNGDVTNVLNKRRVRPAVANHNNYGHEMTGDSSAQAGASALENSGNLSIDALGIENRPIRAPKVLKKKKKKASRRAIRNQNSAVDSYIAENAALLRRRPANAGNPSFYEWQYQPAPQPAVPSERGGTGTTQ